MNESGERKDLLKRAFLRIEELERELESGRDFTREPLAIVGMSCRFPGGANTPEDFWQRLQAGFDATCEIPADRWDVDAYYDADPEAAGCMYTRRGAFLDTQVDRFDAQFFGIAPREADAMDPQQRLLLEVVWEALERGGQASSRLSGSATGVFVGMTAHDWAHIQDRGTDTTYIDTYYGTGTSHSVAAGRIAYILGLKGPALTIDTACSSSLVAFHAACQSLRAGEIRMGIVAGVLLMLTPNGHVIASSGRMLSRDGRCKAFDARADGYARGEGCGVVLLKRLRDAQADGDNILALVRGTASNQDGRSAGLTAPNARAQEEVISAALKASGLEPRAVSYVEAHGTGTELGDPIEIQSLSAVHAGRDRDLPPLYVGAVKTNIGHLESTAGIAGVIKTVLALQHGVIPPNLHFETPNPHIPWETSPVRIPTEPIPWPVIDRRRIAGVSSFGFSGTNVHVILETAPTVEASEAEGQPKLPAVYALSARTPAALAELAGRIASRLEADPSLDPQRVASTLSCGRSHWEHRAAAVIDSHAGLLAALRETADGGADILRGEALIKRSPRVAFLFTGQGSQRPGMARELLATDPVFRTELERCDAILQPLLGRSILELVRADSEDAEAAAALQQTRVTQPVLFGVEWALARMWRSWGVEPAVVMGHSLGEYVAACVAGVFSLEQGLRLVAARGRLLGELPTGGAMAAVFADEATVRASLEPFAGRLDVAAVNGAANTVVSGEEAAVEELLSTLGRQSVEGKRLVVSHAFHSRLMEPALETFKAVADEIRYRSPQIDLILNRTGARAEAIPDADYWVRHIREPVRFAESVASLRQAGATVLLELGPAPVLLGLAAACPGASPAEVYAPSLRPGRDAAWSTREALASLYVAGVPVAWERIPPGRLQAVELPTYPFQRERHWPTLQRRKKQLPADGHPLLGLALQSPRLKGAVFEALLDESDPDWVACHRVFGRAVLPATAYLELARAAGAASGRAYPVVENIHILEPLAVTAPRRVQTLIDGDRLEVVSRAAEGDEWQTHMVARLVDGQGSSPDHTTFPNEAGEIWDSAEYLARIEAAGVAYSGPFRSLGRITRGEGWARGEIDASMLPLSEKRHYGVHPAFLDAAFQLCGACLSAESSVYLPVDITAYRVIPGQAPTELQGLQALALLREGDAGASQLLCDVRLTDASGRELARVDGIRFQRVGTPDALLERRVLETLYEVQWTDCRIPEASVAAGLWYVVGDGDDTAAVVRALQRLGRTAEHRSPDDALTADPSPEGIVFVAPTAGTEMRAAEIGGALRRSLEPLHLLGRALAEASLPPRLCVVSRGAVAVARGDTVNPVNAALWGLGQTMAAEIPAAGCRRIDLPPAAVGSLPAGLADALLMDGPEDRLAYRGEDWRAARLVRYGSEFVRQARVRPQPAYRLEVEEQGRLDRLALVPDRPQPPAADQVQIRVCSTGLNFRDVLNVLGMYPGDAGPLGSECVGTVEAVGRSVRDLSPGDRVMAITPRGFCSLVNASAAVTVPVPKGMSTGAAATIPIAFLTADWALNVLGGMQAGERVLIHAAAGGVGMAAVQLARLAGAEVFATAGSERKRAVLRRMGIRHIYDSRSVDFREQILADTDGAGVHLVLNALTGDAIQASFEVLCDDGRFLEIGKTGVWDEERVRALRPNARYHVIYLGEACAQEPERVRARFLALADRFAAGDLQPLPVQRFLVDEAVEAFHYMAQARHIGKVVLFDQISEADRLNGGAVWITGGIGGLGLAIARDLVNRGARQLALTGRSGPSAIAQDAIDALRNLGADVLVAECDVADIDSMRRVRDQIEGKGWMLRHVLHAAGQLADGVLATLDWEDFDAVLRAKAVGALNLHEVTADLPLESFVLFSAGAALLGSPGQSNYAAANAFLDGLAQWRCAQGLPGTAIAWGPWSVVGMAARARLDWRDHGMEPISPELGTAAFRRLLRDGAVQAAVLPINWARFPIERPGGGRAPFFDLLADEGYSGGRAAPERSPQMLDRAELNAMEPAERLEWITRYIQSALAGVLRLDTDKIGTGADIADYGFDSLLAVELRNRIETEVGVLVPASSLLMGMTLADLAKELSEMIARTDATPNRVDESVWTEGEI
ncbi:SDR family NAD(P)-dependent oxidoreductase [Methylonatrum kenyense]|uniref:type I polyketide synthase n=1 Tax=Methylonatrum kenyense TaxID=455253 RepID=UPI0020BEE638|nr:type I polyketide synthase [Methylonatrum kenyense]MCK8516798.1 SDR family NAD(P)-dependent oxidoreductase [Methylonatrum kenyense]